MSNQKEKKKSGVWSHIKKMFNSEGSNFNAQKAKASEAHEYQSPETVLASYSPVCNVEAFVEKSKDCYYLYLWINGGSEMQQIKPCWICNRTPAPDEIDIEVLKKGRAPAMPKRYVNHDINGMELDEDKLELQWYEEGNAAILLYEKKVIAVIPPQDFGDGFTGFSIYAKGRSPYAWELEPTLHEYFTEKARECKVFWSYFDTPYWTEVQPKHLEILEHFFGRHESYFAIDEGRFPAKALARGSKDGVIYGITLGVSLIPMPDVERYVDDYRKIRRMELGFACEKNREDICMMMYSTLSSISRFPWVNFKFLGHGHTILFDQLQGYVALLFINSKMVKEIDAPEYFGCFDEDINLLWAVPVTKSEYDLIVENGIDMYLSRLGDEEKSRVHIFK